MTNIWKVAAGKGGKYIEDFESLICGAVGWNEMGDVTKIADREESGASAREEVK